MQVSYRENFMIYKQPDCDYCIVRFATIAECCGVVVSGIAMGRGVASGAAKWTA